MISTVKEIIEDLMKLNPDEVLVYTYWGEDDYKDYKDPEQALGLIEDGLDTCIGHVNEYLEGQYQDEEGDEDE
jgi:hypothetical protein